MGLGEEEVACLCSAGLLHDIGMASISDEILNKNGMLTEKEQREVLRHPEVGRPDTHANGDTAVYARQCSTTMKMGRYGLSPRPGR